MRTFVFALLLLVGCQKASEDKKNDKPKPAAVDAGKGGTDVPAEAEVKDIDSKECLGRTEVADVVDVKHVLIGWKELESVYGGQMDPRAKERTNAEAAKLAQEIYEKLKKDPSQIDALVKQYSEDPGSQSGDPYHIEAKTNFVPEFKALSLRLKEGECGIVKTQYGYHVVERIAPPPPDPLASTDILARPANPGTVQVLHVLIGWKDVPSAKRRPVDPRAEKRTKADADKLAQEILAKAKGGADFKALMKEYSEDPGSKDSGQTYDVSADASLVPPFKDLSMRLNVDEVGMVTTMFGWHIIKRVPPPPPDKLESADILAREPVTQKAKVKHILLGWKEFNAGDPRGSGRSRADLEKLVKKTMARIKKGEKFEDLMKELSEDPGSAAGGTGYDVTPDAGLVPPFKDLSLRLKVGEVGAVKTQFGIHIIQRTE